MSDVSPTAPPASEEGVRVWDPFVRLLHWLVVLCCLGAFVFERPRDLHETLGLIVAGAVALRVIWGIIGTRHARFADFVTGPTALSGYFRALVRGRESRYLGHNPAGGAMIVALLGTLSALAFSGWLMTTDALWGVEWVEELHELLANGLLLLVTLHVTGVVVESVRHRENLVKAMVTGVKRK